MKSIAAAQNLIGLAGAISQKNYTIETKIDSIFPPTEQQCLHKQCKNCNGTSKTKNGNYCKHKFTCSCDKCIEFDLLNGI